MSVLTSRLPADARAIATLTATLALPVLMAVSLLFAVAFDQGQIAQVLKAAAGDSTVHEFFHDARHMLGFPCH